MNSVLGLVRVGVERVKRMCEVLSLPFQIVYQQPKRPNLPLDISQRSDSLLRSKLKTLVPKHLDCCSLRPQFVYRRVRKRVKRLRSRQSAARRRYDTLQPGGGSQLFASARRSVHCIHCLFELSAHGFCAAVAGPASFRATPSCAGRAAARQNRKGRHERHCRWTRCRPAV